MIDGQTIVLQKPQHITTMSNLTSTPKYVKEIEQNVEQQLKLIILKKPTSKLFETQQTHYDAVLRVYQQAFHELICKTVACANALRSIKKSYDDALMIRDKRISQFITQDRIFGISDKKRARDEKLNSALEENQALKQANLKLSTEISQLTSELEKIKRQNFTDYLELMKERDARYSLYHKNLKLETQIKELIGCSEIVVDTFNDPLILRIALDRCREQLSITQTKLKSMMDEYSETVPRTEYDKLEIKLFELKGAFDEANKEKIIILDKLDRVQAQKKSIAEELSEIKDRCSELERSGTPRPHWEMCANFIGGGIDRWLQLANGLSSRDTLKVLLKELGPAAETDHWEHFEGLGTDPMIPPYLRYEGKVRNLRLSRREISVIVNDIWLGKLENGLDFSMQEYVNKYFEDRYQQPSVRAEWAYNLCSGAEQMLDEPQIKLFWGVLHDQLSEDIYWGLRTQWYNLKENLYKHSKNGEHITLEDFEKVSKNIFPLKSEVDIKNLIDVVKKSLKLKINSNEVNLEKLFQENEEGFDRLELAKEMYRQRQMAQDKYIREIVAELGGKQSANKMISVENLKRAFAIIDPAIDHIRMERNVRWAFSNKNSDIKTLGPLPLRIIASRLAAGDIERVGPRSKGPSRRRTTSFK